MVCVRDHDNDAAEEHQNKTACRPIYTDSHFIVLGPKRMSPANDQDDFDKMVFLKAMCAVVSGGDVIIGLYIPHKMGKTWKYEVENN